MKLTKEEKENLRRCVNFLHKYTNHLLDCQGSKMQIRVQTRKEVEDVIKNTVFLLGLIAKLLQKGEQNAS